MELMPALFLGHGSPMNTLDDNRYTRAWRAVGAALPRPRAIVAISAHWYIGATAVTAMPRPRTIHDFYGFPPELFAFQYPAAGAPDVAMELAEIVKPVWIGLDHESWGIDHGTWSVLAHLFPTADVPVVQLSVNAHEKPDYHLGLAARLAPLRKRGVLVVASGNIVHNLRRIDWKMQGGGHDWAQRFDDAAREILTTTPGNVPRLLEHPDSAAAVPTPDHFLPMLYLAGLADAARRAADVIVAGCDLGSLSMTAYSLDAECPKATSGGGTTRMPDPGTVPPDAANI
jgi:4,5-DOPA dioxygenase extradiol